MAYRRDIPFDFEFDNNGDLKMAENERAISQSLYTIMRTNKGDKPGVYDFGSDLEAEVFTHVKPLSFLYLSIERRLFEVVSEYERNVNIEEIRLNWSDDTQNSLSIIVTFSVNTEENRRIFTEEISIIDRRNIQVEGLSNG